MRRKRNERKEIFCVHAKNWVALFIFIRKKAGELSDWCLGEDIKLYGFSLSLEFRPTNNKLNFSLRPKAND
jgi:hypothetical protein